VFDVKGTFTVPRVEGLSRGEFEERFLFPQRPVIVSGAMKGWPARERWTNDYLKEKIGARTIRVSKGDGCTHLADTKNKIADWSPMKFAEYIDLLEGGAISDGGLYVLQLPIRKVVPELWPDVRFPTFVDEHKYVSVNFWFGPGSHVTSLHFDGVNNFLTQIRGRKQVILCPPREIARLYPVPVSYMANYFSQVNVASPDLTQFPAWADADRAVFEIGPGDMLFIPSFWWHAVRGVDQNMSINYWWRSRAADSLRHPRQMARYAYSGVYWGIVLAYRHGVERFAGRSSRAPARQARAD
jgi:hypothetical protein